MEPNFPFEIAEATSSHEAEIIDFLLSDLIHKGVTSKQSLVIRDANGKLIATQIASILERQANDQENNNSQDQIKLEGEIRKIAGLLEKLDEQIWTTVPLEVTRLFYIMIISVSSHFGRRGIANRLMANAVQQAQNTGCHGILAEATAYNSQKLFEKCGFTVLYEVKHSDYLDETGKRIIHCRDQTDSAQLVFKKV
ncbi:unnamed protein product, partial [Mesorhabditis belari]|uniref:aralkylamine N-acetyltransferase n=1 Tax=Mesorhabditis belari TaxID=2138241 RepID=A0AAF3ET39_9BILA